MVKPNRESRFVELHRKFRAWLTQSSPAGAPRLDLQVLEERVLYSATPLPVDSADSIDVNLDHLDSSMQAILVDPHAAPQPDTSAATANPNTSDSHAPAPSADSSSDASANTSDVRSLVFLDASLDDLDLLLAQYDQDGHTDVHLLDSHSDGLAQVSAVLNGSSTDYSSIQFLTHGSDGCIQLGDTLLTTDNIGQYQSQLESWGQHLTADADILFYGCDVAHTADGQALLTSIAAWTDADVTFDDRQAPSIHLRHEVVFVQDGLYDQQHLLEDLYGNQSENVIVDVVVLNRLEDGFGQVDNYLAQYHNLDAIHFVTHGTDGFVQLGGSWLTYWNVDSHAADLQRWGMALSADGDILIYGCDVAASETGQSMLDSIALFTQADVAASTDSTGSIARGGNWDFEWSSGDIETSVAFSSELQHSYESLWATYTVTSAGGGTGAGTLRAAITNANSNPGLDTIVFNIGTGVQTINLGGAIADITGAVVIDGTTQGGYSGTPLIVVNGGGTIQDGFRLYSGSTGSTIRGLVIQNFYEDGIDIYQSNGNTIVGNYIGITQAGTAAAGNQQGINIYDSNNSIIGGTTAADRNVISSNTASGIGIAGSSTNNLIRGNYIGTNAAGTGDLGNANYGISVDSSGNTIGGNVAGAGNVISGTGTSGTSSIGIALWGTASGTTIQGNYIGTNAAGTSAIANQGNGIQVLSSGNTIGGTTSLTRNVISGNAASGILLTGASATGNSILGNYIGTNAAGTSALANSSEGIRLASSAGSNTIGGTTAAAGNVISGNAGLAGIYLNNSSSNTIQRNYIGLNAAGTGPIANQYGIYADGTSSSNNIGTASNGNIISGNSSIGVFLTGSTVTNNLIRGNTIGLNAAGSAALSNGAFGIAVDALATNNTIGGSTAGQGNVISGNTGATGSAARGGIFINANNTIIQGNHIGVDAAGTTIFANGQSAVGNSAGIYIAFGSGSTIGGTAAGAGNTIAGNFGDGILISNAGTHSILGNSIYSNTEQGIDLGADDGITYNDINDADSGANGLLNFPILKTATTSGGNTTITGKVQGLASTTFRVEFFSNAYGAQNSSGYGSGRTYLGSASVTTDALGNATFSQLLSGVTLSAGTTVSATATIDVSGVFGATSEFSGNILANQSNLMISGTYTGSGVDDRVIAGLGFRPDLVIVFSEAANIAAIRTSDMSGDIAKSMTGATALSADRIQSLTGDGFTIGTNAQVNTSAVIYHWVAFGAGADIDVGAFTGTGSNQNINGLGFQPEFVMTMSSDAQAALFRSSLNANSFDFSNSASTSTGITALNADGFSVGTSAGANSSGAIIYYVAFNQNSDYFTLNTYTGNGVDNRNITGLGFEPEFVFTKQTNTANQAAFKTESTGYSVDKSIFGYGSTQNSNRIQNLQADGFQIGTNSVVNTNAGTYTYFAFKQHDAPLIVDTTSDTSDGTVTSINALRASKGADGVISLREAITAANNTHNGTIADQIQFNIAGAGVQTILVTGSALPTITDAVKIDATTQPGYAGAPLIELKGTSAGAGANGFYVMSGGSTIKGFVIDAFSGYAIYLQTGGNNLIEGNYIGTNAAGTAASANGWGIVLANSSNNTIGGISATSRNVISGNTNDGINSGGTSSGNYILGNYIGTNAAGTAAIANAGYGIGLGGAGNSIIGGTAAGSRNVISGNGSAGIAISAGTSNQILGNYIGLNAAGTTAVGNGSRGIYISSTTGTIIGDGTVAGRNVISGNSSDGIYTLNSNGTVIRGNYIGTDSTGTLIRGNAGYGLFISGSSSVIVDANLVSGNTLGGMSLWGSGTTLASVTSNYIGTNAAGTGTLGNTEDGIKIGGGANNNTIGGDRTLGKGNVISGNTGANSDGIEISGSGGATNNNKIYGNLIGTNATGTAAIANGRHGIVVYSGAQGTLIGGTGTGEGNVISGNTTWGIIVDGNSGITTTGTIIVANTIGLNLAGIGILGNGGGGLHYSVELDRPPLAVILPRIVTSSPAIRELALRLPDR